MNQTGIQHMYIWKCHNETSLVKLTYINSKEKNRITEIQTIDTTKEDVEQ
jgi:hypothetical protein